MVYIQKPHSKDDDFIKRGGSVGATIAFWLTIALFCLFVVLIINASGDSMALGMVLPFSIFIALLMAGVGYLLGKLAATCPSVNTAFLKGAILIGLVVVLGIFLPILIMTKLGTLLFRNDIIYMLSLLAIVTSFGALISGISAIYVRDYRNIQRKRLIPQFTLLELFIIFTLLTVIISATSSISMMRM